MSSCSLFFCHSVRDQKVINQYHNWILYVIIKKIGYLILYLYKLKRQPL